MSSLKQLLGNREQAFEDNLEKGRIWVFSDGNMYSGFCNNFCWRPPGTGKAVIEIWGAAGSSAEMCCCGAGLEGNPGAYVKKCICVTAANRVCGYVGRSCNNADDLCFRGCSESTCVCWFGCAPNELTQFGINPCDQTSWKGNNPWGWGNEQTGVSNQATGRGDQNRMEYGCRMHASAGGCGFSNLTGSNPGNCQNKGATEGCLCAQGGRGGTSYCMDTKSAYSCFMTGYFCGQRVGPGHNMCDAGNSACGRVCGHCQGPGHVACAWGGDVNCCGGFSCTDFLGCLQTCPCMTLHHVRTSAGVYAEDGATISYYTDGDATNAAWSGTSTTNLLYALQALSRTPSHGAYNTCWNGARSCGCYNMQGCHPFLPYGVPGGAAFPCGDVRDHGMRGGMGMVRIKYTPTDGGNTY